MRINVNKNNSKVIGGKLFITGLKMSQLNKTLSDFIVRGNTITHPSLGQMYEYEGPYSRA